MTILKMFACLACGRIDFPRRLLCPVCGAMDFDEMAVGEGQVEETTVILHRAGSRAAQEGVTLATVHTVAGPRVIARLDVHVRSGDRVMLSIEASGAIVAHRNDLPEQAKPCVS